jgi:hypothetical protein
LVVEDAECGGDEDDEEDGDGACPFPAAALDICFLSVRIRELAVTKRTR